MEEKSFHLKKTRTALLTLSASDLYDIVFPKIWRVTPNMVTMFHLGRTSLNLASTTKLTQQHKLCTLLLICSYMYILCALIFLYQVQDYI